MKKLLVIALVLFVALSVSAKKSSRIFKELTRTMLISEPVETVKYQNITVSYWKIESGDGGFCYFTEKQEFQGRFKSYNFTVTRNKIIILGINKDKKGAKKETRKAKKDLLLGVVTSQL